MVLESDPEFGSLPAFFFRSGDKGAVSLNSQGSNLPPENAEMPWILARQFALGVQDVGLLEIGPEPILRGIRARGFYVWRISRGGEGQSQ
jgi:hypothetical protein